MSKKSTRSTKPKSEPDEPQKVTAAALKKVFYIPEKLLNHVEGERRLRLERFFHPGKAQAALFITLEQPDEEGQIMELLEHTEPRRSWLVNNEVCSNGRIYMTTPIDATLLALHQLRKHCVKRAMSLDSIHDDQDASANRLLTKFAPAEGLKCVTDVKLSGDESFYKYNAERTMAWLAVKTHHIVKALKVKQVHCGHSAQSQNYVRSDKLAAENTVQEMDYIRMACDMVGRYLDADLHEELVRYLQIPNEMKALAEEKAASQKRKSQGQTGANSKKIKLIDGDDGAMAQLKNNSLLDSSLDDVRSPTNKATPLKERTLTAKEKALAKGAKGTKSISSFFKAK